MNNDFAVFFDGGCTTNPGRVATSAVVVRPPGEIVIEGARWAGEGTNNVAEYRGLQHAIALALLAGAERPLFVSDSMLIVQQVNKWWAVKGDLLAREHGLCTGRLMCFDQWALKHVPREQNKRADWLVGRLIRGADHKRVLKREPAVASIEHDGLTHNGWATTALSKKTA